MVRNSALPEKRMLSEEECQIWSVVMLISPRPKVSKELRVYFNGTFYGILCLSSYVSLGVVYWYVRLRHTCILGHSVQMDKLAEW